MRSLLLGALALGLTSSLLAQEDTTTIQTVSVAPGVYMLVGRGGNIGVSAGEDAVFLVDDQFAPLSRKIIEAVKGISDRPIKFLLNTHWHGDHTGGNENFGKLGALIFGHDNVRIQMALSAYEQEPPLVTFSEDISFHINGETVRVFKVPDAHTNGDSFIHFTSSNVIHTGDVYRTTSYPYIDVENGGSFLGTIKALDLLIEVSDGNTRIIPGHGVLSNVAEVRTVRDMLLVIRDRVIDSIAAGVPLADAQTAGLTAEFDLRWANRTSRIGSPEELLRSAYADLAR